MNQTKTISYTEQELPDYIMEQLTAGILTAFFPVSFVYDQTQRTGIYDTSHFRPLSTLREMSIKELLWIFCQLVQLVAENEKHYLFGETYQISLQTVYVDLLRSKIKMIFLPARGIQETKAQLRDFLDACRTMISEEGRGYLKDMMDYLAREDVGYLNAIHYGEQLQHEIYLCDVQ